MTFDTVAALGPSAVLSRVTRDGASVAQDYCPIAAFSMIVAKRITLESGGEATTEIRWWANNANQDPSNLSSIGCGGGEVLPPGTYELEIRLPRGGRERPPQMATVVVVVS